MRILGEEQSYVSRLSGNIVQDDYSQPDRLPDDLVPLTSINDMDKSHIRWCRAVIISKMAPFLSSSFSPLEIEPLYFVQDYSPTDL